MSRVRQLHFTTLVLSFSLVVSLMFLTLLSSRGAFSDTTDNAGNSFASSTCFGAQPDSVQNGTATSSANGVVSVSITTVDPTLSFLMFSSRHDSNRPVGSMIRGRLNATGDAVEFERVTDEATPVTMTMEWYVVTYLCGITVQRGEVSQAATTINVPIASVGSTSQAFVTWSKTPAATDGAFGNNDPVVAELTSPTNLQFRVDSTGSHIIDWQVIAFDNPSDVNVQTGTTSLLGTATVTSATLSPAVDVTKTFVLASYRTAGSGADIGANMLRAELRNSTTITIDRSISGTPDDITEIFWQAIELKDGSSVQRGRESFPPGTASATVGITTVDTTKAYASGSVQAGSGQNVGRSNYAADDIIGVGSFTAALTGTKLGLTRDNTAATADVSWFVVHWGTAPSAGLSGSLVPSVVEADIVAGGETLVITLTDDTWDATVGADNAITTALINGIDSDGLEGTGWDAVVKAGLTFNEVTRTSSTVVTVTLPAFASFDVVADETVTVTVPASAVASGSPIVATPTFDVVAGADLQQLHYRWRNDDGVETGASPPLQVNATGDVSTTSGSDVVVSGMTLTPGAGDYLVWFSGSVEASGSNTTQNVSIYVNGVKAAHTEREVFTEGSIPDTSFPVATQLYVTGVGAGETIDVRWRTSGGTATMHERTLTVEQVTPADMSQVNATGDVSTTSGSDVVVSGMTLTPGAGDYLVWFSGSVEASGGNTTQNVSIYVNGVKAAHTEREVFTEGSIPDTSFPVATQLYVTGVGAGDTIDVRWRTSGGTATMHERTLTVEQVTPADISQVNATGDVSTTSGSDVVVSGMTLTPGAGDYLVWFSGSLEASGSNTTQNVSIYVNGVKAAHTEREVFTENSIPDTSFPVATQLYVTGVGAGETIDVRWRTSGGTATMHERTLTVEKVTGNATWAAAEDTTLAGLAKNTTKRLRIEVSNDGVASGSVVYRLEVSNPNPVSCDNIATTWTRIDTSTHWDMVTSSYFADGDPTSNISPGLTDPGDKTFLAGELQESPTDQTTGITLSGTQFTEIEYAVEATTSATNGATYCFRLTDTGNPNSFTYTETKYGKVTLS